MPGKCGRRSSRRYRPRPGRRRRVCHRHAQLLAEPGHALARGRGRGRRVGRLLGCEARTSLGGQLEAGGQKPLGILERGQRAELVAAEVVELFVVLVEALHEVAGLVDVVADRPGIGADLEAVAAHRVPLPSITAARKYRTVRGPSSTLAGAVPATRSASSSVVETPRMRAASRGSRSSSASSVAALTRPLRRRRAGRRARRSCRAGTPSIRRRR